MQLSPDVMELVRRALHRHDFKSPQMQSLEHKLHDQLIASGYYQSSDYHRMCDKHNIPLYQR